MKFHNEKLNKQYNNILGALELARSEAEVTLGEHRKTEYDNDEDFNSVQDGLQADIDYINEAIRLTTEWALKIDISIPTSSF